MAAKRALDRSPKVLIIDDSERDSLLILRALGKAGFKPLSRRVDTPQSLREAMATETWDVVLSDCYMPGFNAEAALEICRAQGVDFPFIVISGAVGEEEAVALLKAGAHDFIRKDHLSRLVPTIERELVEAQRRRKHRAAEEALRKFSVVVEQGPVAVTITDVQGNIEYVNNKFVELSGYQAEEVIGHNPRILNSGYTSEPQYRTLWETIRAGKEWHGEFRNRKKNGDFYWQSTWISPIKAAEGNITHFIGISEDITQRKEIEKRTWHQANYDNLTGLANRNLFMDRLQQTLTRAARDHTMLALMYLDLDRFKYVNDTLGHDAGDQLLKQAAGRISACVRESDIVSRLGGDEFTVILPDIVKESVVVAVAERVLEALSPPFPLSNREAYVGASIGITFYPNDALSPRDLLRNADTAMYQAKDAGRNTYRFFTQAMNNRAEERMVLEGALRSALEKNQFSVAYQPIIDLGSGAVIGAEALLRWQQPELGLIPPAEFIPVAEETGLIEPIGAWVLKHVCAQMRRWNCTALAPLHVGVNFSSAQCRAETLKTLVMEVLRETGLPAEWLTLELTESLLIQDTPEIIETLQSLKDMGIRISIDDFGTGYSSLSYLKRFPVDVLKIERSFVRDISTDSSDRALCKAIIAMAHALNLTVIAEGVETEEQLAFLKACECDMAQGFYFSKPLEPAQFEILIGNKATRDRSPDTQRQLG